MTANADYSVNLSVQQVLSLWVQGATLQHFTGTNAAVQCAASTPSVPVRATGARLMPVGRATRAGRRWENNPDVRLINHYAA